MLSIVRKRGCIFVESALLDAAVSTYIKHVPEHAQQTAFARDSTTKHITLATADEIKHTTYSWPETISFSDIHFLGLGSASLGTNTTWYVVVHSPILDAIRAAVGLGPKDFHVTVGFNSTDIHNIDKGPKTLITATDASLRILLDHPTGVSAKQILYLQSYDDRGVVSAGLNPELWYTIARLAGATSQHKTAIKYARLLAGEQHLAGWALLLRVGINSDWRSDTFTKELEGMYDVALTTSSFISPVTQQRYKDWITNYVVARANADAENFAKTSSKCINVAIWLDNILQRIEMPHNFSWLNLGLRSDIGTPVPGKVAATGLPRTRDQMIAIRDIFGIRNIITLLEKPLPIELQISGLQYYHYQIDDTYPPTIEQLNNILEILEDEKKGPTIVHCRGGIGRTGTVLVAYILKTNACVMSLGEAIDCVKNARPCTRLTERQEQLLRQWNNQRWSQMV